MKVPPFATKLCVFSLLFYTALHVSAYKQAIFRCYLTILQKGQVTEFFLRGSTESRYSITAVVCYIAKIQYEIYLGYIIYSITAAVCYIAKIQYKIYLGYIIYSITAVVLYRQNTV
jgi:hypothetical protein